MPKCVAPTNPRRNTASRHKTPGQRPPPVTKSPPTRQTPVRDAFFGVSCALRGNPAARWRMISYLGTRPLARSAAPSACQHEGAPLINLKGCRGFYPAIAASARLRRWTCAGPWDSRATATVRRGAGGSVSLLGDAGGMGAGDGRRDVPGALAADGHRGADVNRHDQQT